MMDTHQQLPQSDDIVQLSDEDLRLAISHIIEIDKLKSKPDMVNAISDIVFCVKELLHGERPFNEIIKHDILRYCHSPIAYEQLDISKSGLAAMPLIVQILALMQDAQAQQSNHNKVFWLAIAMFTAVVTKHYDIKTAYSHLLMQFKLAVFSKSPNRTWLWQELIDLSTTDSISIESIHHNIAAIAKRMNHDIEEINHKNLIEAVAYAKQLKKLETRKSQIEKILYGFERAHYPNYKNAILEEIVKKPPAKQHRNKPITLSRDIDEFLDPVEPAPYFWDTPNDDVEHNGSPIRLDFARPELEAHEGLDLTFEESLDNFDPPYISYEKSPNPLINHVAPLQHIDLTLEQNYIAQRELALNSNTRLLSLVGYQRLFKALAFDAEKLKNNSVDEDNNRNPVCASFLLLSLLTAMPLKSILNKSYLKNTQVFKIGERRSYIQHSLGITKRKDSLDSNNFENESDVIKLPIPSWLIISLLKSSVPNKDSFTAYLKVLRDELELPYSSIARVESTLHTILHRYTPNCNTHIADLICRISAPHAPAMYYSSHTSEELLEHYKSALTVLNGSDDSSDIGLDLSYITPWHKYTLGSPFALKSGFVCEILESLYKWTESSTSVEMHFNRTTLYVWFVFCLLTGVRPNNNLGNINNLDLDINGRWLIIDDKPSRATKTHRLIPLCSTLITYLNSYRDYVSHYQLNHQYNSEINSAVDQLKNGKDISLLRLLSSSYIQLSPIKRGDVYKYTKAIIDLDPYWTRHFVRTQLEKKAINIELINAIIGHEKSRQQALGRFASISKADVRAVSASFDNIAIELKLNRDPLLPQMKGATS